MNQVSNLCHDNSSAAEKLFRLWVLLFRTKDLLHKFRDKELQQAAGISVAMGSVLLYTHALGNKATIAELARWKAVETHNISQIVTRMEKKGLVQRVKDFDKNLIRVEMTEKGQQVYTHHVANRESIYRVMSELSDEEQDQLASCLEKVRRRCFQEMHNSIRPPLP